MKIDFSKLQVETRIEQFDELDLREDIGNILFSNASTLAEDELARRIYKSEGAVEMTEKEAEMLVNSLKASKVVFRVVQAVEKQLK